MKQKLVLIGFLVIVLLAVPLTLLLLSKQTKPRTPAAPATNLSLVTTQQNITVGQTFNVNVNIDPGSNQISFIKLNISYDKTILATGSAGITPNPSLNLIALDGPHYNQCAGNTCFISVSYGIGANKNNAIKAADTLATISFIANASTANTGSTTIGFGGNQSGSGVGNGNQAYSLAPTDEPTQNSILNTQSLQLTIADVPTPTPGSATSTPTPTGGSGGGGSPTNTPIPTSSGSGGGTGVTTNSSLLCNSLTADNNSSPSAPFTVNFTVVGSDSTASINQVTFNFGDGNTQDVTTGGGIGTGSLNAQIAHTYANNGSFTASAILTDSTGATSNSSSCTQSISVGSNIPTNTPTPGVTGNPITNMKTGPGDKFVIFGGIGTVVTVIGAILLFAL